MATAIIEPVATRAGTELPRLMSWGNLTVAAMIYACTNPGRAQGLGVITEAILDDFKLTRTQFGQINFWATMAVAALSLGFGTVIDRLGSYRAAWTLTSLTAAATAFTAVAGGPWTLFAAIALARLFGQGVLAVVSTGILGKSFLPRHAPLTAAVYLVLTTLFYAAMIQGVRTGLIDFRMTWREIWLVIASVMAFMVLPVSVMLLIEPKVPPPDRSAMRGTTDGDRTVWEAIRHPIFIVFGLYCLVFGTAVKGMDAFNESLLKDRGFGKEVFFDSLLLGVLSLIVFKFAIAWLCHVWSIGKVLAIGMLLSAATVGSVSLLDTSTDVYIWSLLKALSWSIYVVVYFSIWVYAFGRRDLAQIQGAIHVVTITSSGLGPLVLGICRDQLGSYLPVLHVLAGTVFLLGLAMLFVNVPCVDSRSGTPK